MRNRFTRMARRTVLCGAVSALIIDTASCGNRDSQAVRHLVLADLIQREGVPGG